MLAIRLSCSSGVGIYLIWLSCSSGVIDKVELVLLTRLSCSSSVGYTVEL